MLQILRRNFYRQNVLDSRSSLLKILHSINSPMSSVVWLSLKDSGSRINCCRRLAAKCNQWGSSDVERWLNSNSRELQHSYVWEWRQRCQGGQWHCLQRRCCTNLCSGPRQPLHLLQGAGLRLGITPIRFLSSFSLASVPEKLIRIDGRIKF